MIKIPRYPPPAHYEKKVRQRGLDYLAENPKPKSAQFSRHNYWRHVRDDLQNLYGGICAYCASWTPRGQLSIDHFIPRTEIPRMAYEWDNFRLCRARLNGSKANSLEVMDPMYITDGWFVIDFPTFWLRPLSSAPDFVKKHVQDTINCLKLNHDDYVQERIGIIEMYACDEITLDQVRSKWPFLAAEMTRQDFERHYKPRMRRHFAHKNGK